MSSTRNLLRKSIRTLIKEALQKEAYIKQVAHKSATGEKFEADDVMGVFQMSFDASEDATAAEGSVAGWQNLFDGLADEGARQIARDARSRIQRLSKQYDKTKLTLQYTQPSDSDYKYLKRALDDAESQLTQLKSQLHKVAEYLSKRHSSHRVAGPSRGGITRETSPTGNPTVVARKQN